MMQPVAEAYDKVRAQYLPKRTLWQRFAGAGESRRGGAFAHDLGEAVR
jgi:hypothetical protein